MNFKVDNQQVLETAMSKLVEIRTQISNLKRFEDDYKDKIKTILEKMGQDTYSSDRYFVKVSSSVRKSLDTNKVKAHLGADVDQFMKETTFTKLDVKEVQQ